MAIYKNESNNTWYVMARYQDWTGERKQKCKRGFATKREAAQWEQQFILQKKASMDMELESFCKLYEEDVRPRLKKSTWFTKENIIKSKKTTVTRNLSISTRSMWTSIMDRMRKKKI